LLLAAAGASASPTLTNLDGTFDPFGGFDWNKAGNVVTSGAIVNGGTVTSTYWANAVLIVDTASNPFNTPNLIPPAPGTYEYTALATITETVSCGGAIGAACGTSANFTATGGNWQVFYDTSPDSNLVTGAGITDGTLLIAGDVQSGGGSFLLLNATGGTGSFAYQGAVTFTNTAFINPALQGSTAVATLQFGSFTTNWVAPTSQPGAAGGTAPLTQPSLAFQADGNQAFTSAPVPEPGSLALLAGAFLALGFVRKRSK